MKMNNPVFDPTINAKVRTTYKQRVKDGIIVFRKGKDHWLWKGNRNRCQVIRSRLYRPWIRPIMERDGFSCTRCGNHGGKLEVHHCGKKFEEIVEEVLAGRKMNDLTDVEFELVSGAVIESHKRCEGKTYCPRCHGIIDPQRRHTLPNLRQKR
jgi:hypothetical protein